MATFGDRLKELRKERNKTQKELANKFNMSESAIGMYERNERTPSQELTKEIADYFQVTVDYLLGRSDFKKWSDESKKLSSNRAYYGGGDDWTEDEKQAADAFIEMLRKRKIDQDKK